MPSNRKPHVALVTCAALPDLDPDDQRVLEPLRRRSVQASAAVWDDPSVDWHSFDLAVIRSTWDYTSRRDEFLAWTRTVPRLANRADVIEWNTDKRYLVELAHAGLPVVETTRIEPGDPVSLPISGAHVVKPSVGAGSLDAARYDLADPAQSADARAHAERLLTGGRSVIVQPYISSVDERGETGLMLFGGRYSHAMVKGPMLAGRDELDASGLYRAEEIEARRPSAAELELAQRTLESLPWSPTSLLYARVDVVAGDNGRPLLIELELTEPSLFMGTAPGSEERLADAIVAAVSR